MFDTIDYLLFRKNKPELDNELLTGFVPYMVTRYLSFYDKNVVGYANDTLNRYTGIFKSKEEQFRFHDNIIPKLKRKKIQYIKKPKPAKEKEEKPIPEFYSKREIEMLTKTLEDIKS